MRNPNEWNLLREEFDTLVHTEGVRRDELEQILDHQMRLRFGELIAWAAGHKSKDYHGPGRRDPECSGLSFVPAKAALFLFLSQTNKSKSATAVRRNELATAGHTIGQNQMRLGTRRQLRGSSAIIK